MDDSARDGGTGRGERVLDQDGANLAEKTAAEPGKQIHDVLEVGYGDVFGDVDVFGTPDHSGAALLGHARTRNILESFICFTPAARLGIGR